ncbi:MAG: DEAD/DEAH box helicase family protein, partial [Nitrososphaeraceae archaeon]|nr:DEAD/DEAH box helicase family protein [Nitrososphaeraceae archaeon]
MAAFTSLIKLEDNLAIPGVYILELPLYKSENLVKIGCSTDINKRIKSGSYRTACLSKDYPKLLGYMTHPNFTTLNEVKYLEGCIHQLFSKELIERELFKIDMNDPEKINRLEIFANNFSNRSTFVHGEFETDNTVFTGEISGDVSNSPVLDEIIRNGNTFKVLTHQEPIIETIHSFYTQSNKGKVILPCGYGKMYIALFYLVRGSHQNVLVLVPSLILLDQFIDVASKILLDWNICSYSSENKVLELAQRNLIVSTYQSITDLVSEQSTVNFVPDFVIYDEAHKTCVNKSKYDYSLFHNSVNLFPEAKKMFMTATEKIVCTNDHNDILTKYSMDSEAYGLDIVRKTFEDAIREQIIIDYLLAIPLCNGSDVNIIISALNELYLHHL